MNSTKFHYALIFFLCLLPFIPIFLNPNLNYTHDGEVHIARMAEYFKLLTDGQIPPRWAGNFNYGYGMPTFIFIYPLPYLISSFFLLFKIELIITFKLSLYLSFVFSGLFMYLFSRHYFKDNIKALTVTIFYQFNSFRFVDLITRGALGEAYTFVFLPIILLGLSRLSEKRTVLNTSLVIIGTTLLILSHNSISLIFFLTCIGSSLIFNHQKKIFIFSLASLFLGVGIATFYWLPAIFEHKYTYGGIFFQDYYLNHFPSIPSIFIPNLIGDPYRFIDKITPQLGLMQMVAIVGGILVLFRKSVDNKDRKIIIFALILFSIALFFMQPVSSPIWGHLVLLKQLQFPWRFLTVTTFATAILAVSLAQFIHRNFYKKLIISILLGITILSSVNYWFPPAGYRKVEEKFFWNFPYTGNALNELDVIWTAPASAYPNQPVEIVSGEGRIENLYRRTDYHSFKLTNNFPVKLVEHTIYFPGWRVYVDGKKVSDIQFQDPNFRGLIQFSVPPGNHRVELRFERTKIRLLSDLVSVFSIMTAIIFIYSMYYFRHRKIV